MKHALWLFSALLLAPAARAESPAGAPPAAITRAGYETWLHSLNSNVSAFLDNAFDWYDRQLKSPLPAQVATDPDKIYVNVDRALQETIALESSGDIEEGNTVGFDAYALIDVPVQVALETKLFNWGKPVGQAAGTTYPYDTVFSSSRFTLSERWGAGNYYSRSVQTGGGIVKDLHDDYTVLVRGDAVHGYTLFITYFGPNGDTATQAHISIIMLTPTANGKTEYRQCVRQNGQSYKIFGIEFGRKNFGFNVARDRQGVKALMNTMAELKNTGKIKENRP